MCSRAPESRIYFVEQAQHFHYLKQDMVTTYHNHVVRGGQLKTESFQAGSHMYNTRRLFLKTPEHISKYTNFIGRNVILNFYKIDIYLLFTKTLNDRPFVPAAAVIFHMT